MVAEVRDEHDDDGHGYWPALQDIITWWLGRLSANPDDPDDDDDELIHRYVYWLADKREHVFDGLG